MAGEWRNGRLGDYILLQSGGTPSKSRPDYWSGDLPWVSAKDMKSYWIDDTEDHLSEVGANAATRVVEGGTTLLLVRGMTLHNDVPICRVRRRSAFNQDVKAVLPRAGTDPEFIPYLLLGNKTRLLSIVDSAGHGTGRINSDTLLDLPVNVPPLGGQRAIACILGSLDDKIELNRRMNRTLEEMARAIFKSWFIDFDPVRAKAAVRRQHPKWTDEQVGRAACPKLKPEIARLFPDSFEDSELGEIPKGWRVGTFGDIAEHQRRGLQPKSIERNTPYIALEHMPRRSITLSAWSKADGLESNKFRFKKGEILFGKLRPYFHKVGVAPVDGVCSTDIVVVTPRQQGWFGFVLGHASSEQFVEYTNAGSTGTKMPRTSWADMARYKLSVPPEPVTAKFTELVQSSVDRIVASIQESGTLAALRDALLPKLISGELRIPDAERIVQRKV